MHATVTSVLSFYNFKDILQRPRNAFIQDSQEGYCYLTAEETESVLHC